ncbi:thiolase family protein, partial [Pseudomonas aeruginosa]
MSRVPMGSNREIHGEAFGWMASERYELTSQGEAAERMADKWSLSRDELDDYAFASHSRAAAAEDAGHLAKEIIEEPGETLREHGLSEAVVQLR